jgi:hypothetical protein
MLEICVWFSVATVCALKRLEKGESIVYYHAQMYVNYSVFVVYIIKYELISQEKTSRIS